VARCDAFLLQRAGHHADRLEPMLAIGSATSLLQKAGIPETLVTGQADPGLLLMERDDVTGIAAFIAAIAKHRHFERETDPPRV
jgi:catalase